MYIYLEVLMFCSNLKCDCMSNHVYLFTIFKQTGWHGSVWWWSARFDKGQYGRVKETRITFISLNPVNAIDLILSHL